MSELSRREMLQATAAALSLPLVKLPVAAGQAPKKFFTPAEFAVVDELTDMIIPTDEKSGGARAPGVAAYIDARLAESFEPEPPAQWRPGLKAVDDPSRELKGRAWMGSTHGR